MTTQAHEIIDTVQTDCCIVGGGPAGVILSLLLARQGISVTLLETHRDFDRDFRGDNIHPLTMEIMAELGIAERLLQLPHTKIDQLTLRTTENNLSFSADFRHLKTHYPYITIMPQARFLEFVVEEAKQYPNFQLVLGANAQELIEEEGIIQGLLYKGHGGWHEVKAKITIGADGRNSRVRELAGLKPVQTSTPMDVLWFRMPRMPEDGVGLNGRIGKGRMLALLNRTEQWQVAYIIPKGGYQQVRTEGLERFRQNLVEVMPEFKDRVNTLQDWHQIAFLSVESSFVSRWYRPGLLLIGDAAHVMSPVGGVGINYAIQDAVATANILSQPLKQKQVQIQDLASVQRRREMPTRFIQAFQSLLQQRIIKSALDEQQTFKFPVILKLPFFRNLLPQIIGFGLFPVHLKKSIL